MQKLVELFEYIISGDALVLYGAGLSADAGLPAWGSLLKKGYESLDDAEKKSAQGRAVRAAITEGLYPRAFDYISQIKTAEWVVAEVEKNLEKKAPGKMYKALSTLPFKGYLTTNYDDILIDELRAKKAISVHLNTQKDIQEVDFDALTSVVKIHGDFSDHETLILGEKTYNNVLKDRHYEYLRTFIQSQVIARRLVIIGYSLADPDMRLILEEAQKKIRRSTPMFALVPNADAKQIKEWTLKYNIKIISYPDMDGKHAGLLRLLEILQQYNSVDPEEILDTPEDMEHVQHLYMWHKFSFSTDNTEEESTQGAVDSIIVGLVGDAGGRRTSDELLSMLSTYLPHSEKLKGILEGSLQRLDNTHGFVCQASGGVVELSPAGRKAYESSRGKYERLCDVFKDQLILEAKKDIKLSSKDGKQLANIALRHF